MNLSKLSKKELREISKAFSKSPIMIKKRESAEKVFNSPQFLEFIKNREAEIKKRNADKKKRISRR